MQINHCIILCGGRGTRLREFNLTDQKCLIHINGVPFIEYLLKQFSQYKITLCTGHLGEQVEVYYRDNKNIILSREKKPLGTGGAIINALGKIKDDLIIISNGDSFCEFDLNHATKIFLEKDIDFLMITTDNFKDLGDYGMVEINEKSRIKSFNEKPSNAGLDNLMNCGVYIAKKRVFKNYEVANISLEKDVIPEIVKNYKCYSHNVHSKVYDIGTPERIKIAENFFKKQ